MWLTRVQFVNVSVYDGLVTTIFTHWTLVYCMVKFCFTIYRRVILAIYLLQETPLIAYKRQQYIRQYVIRSKVQKKQTLEKRNPRGMKKCWQNCTMCRESKVIKINGIEWKINHKLHCKSDNEVVAFICKEDNWREVYVGKTKRFLKLHVDEHQGNISNRKIEKATGEHFSQPSHSLADILVTALERVKRNNILYRKEREEYFIRLFYTYNREINKKR